MDKQLNIAVLLIGGVVFLFIRSLPEEKGLLPVGSDKDYTLISS